jgi:hypothetical protein
MISPAIPKLEDVQRGFRPAVSPLANMQLMLLLKDVRRCL